MWRRSRKLSPTEDSSSLLSISGLGRQHNHGVLEPGWPSSPRSWVNRAAVRPATASITGSARDDQLSEVVSHHEQLITALSERVLTLDDQVERLQADVLPVLKMLSKLVTSQQGDQGLSPSKAAAAAQRQSDAAGKDQACCVAAIEDPNSTSASATNNGLTTTATAADAPAQTAAAPVLQWGGLFQGAAEVDPAVQRALAELAAAGAGLQSHAGSLLGPDRDECGSMRSFCTSISCGSTQVSAPAMMKDLRPAAKAPSRATQQLSLQQQQHPSLQFAWNSIVAGAAVPATNNAAAHAADWPMQLDLAEECTPEELQQMIDTVLDYSTAPKAADEKSKLPDHQLPEQQDQQQELTELQQAISCLALHAERDEEVRQQLCTPSFLQKLVSLLQTTDICCMQGAAHLVWYISRSDTLRQHLQQQGQLLQSLLALLAIPDAASARAAAFALNNMAYDPACRAAMVDGGAVAGLIDMLSGCDALGQEAAAAALMMLASEEANIRAQIVALNGIQALVEVLQYGGPAAQEAAASALENLSLDSTCEAALAAEGAIEALLQVLKDGTTGAMAAAVGALRNLAVNEELEQHLLTAGSIEVLVGLVGNSREDVGVRTAALEGLRNLAASSTRSGDLLIQAGGAPALVDAARSLPAATARSAALGALLVLSCDDNHRKAISAAGAAGVLVHAALSGSQTSKEYAARALANLATTEANRSDLLREGATVLAHLLKSQLAVLKAHAGTTEGAVDNAMSSSGSSGCCLAAARALQNLSKYRPGCKQMLDAGCLPPLVSALAVAGLIATAATSALCSLCTSSRSLQELAKCDGCNKLVTAVSKPKHLTPRGQKNALRLLRRLVKGPSSCKAAVKQQVAALGLQLV